MVGEGPMRAEIEAEIQRTGAPVRLLGFFNQSEMPEAYALADVLVLPSETETWGLVVNEALACGLPAVVSSGVGCAPDLVEPGATGETYPMGDVDALAVAMERALHLARDPATAHALKVKMETYSLETAILGTLEAVKAVRSLREG